MSEETEGTYLRQVVAAHTKLLDQASDIARHGPATSLQITGIYMIVGAALVRVVSSVKFPIVSIDYTTIDFAITLCAGAFLFAGGAYISLVEYKDKVKWYENQLSLTNQNSQKAFELGVEHAKPNAQPSPPGFTNKTPFQPRVGE